MRMAGILIADSLNTASLHQCDGLLFRAKALSAAHLQSRGRLKKVLGFS
jgi:hypothetical protein